ncbi:CAAX protease self-immunity [Allokutzneria albata]|uniref:CAAX protease self-immunity n=1 Tax=Allokutzneria albata TaxID=211114 RepID=A0A1G9R9W0_ALLAB|nr:CAAX protease self-immunity [Allokutzneria albata]
MRPTPRAGKGLLVGGVAVYVAALLGLVLTGNTALRYTADHGGTRPLWLMWTPVVAGLVAAVLLAPRKPAADPFTGTEPRRIALQAWTLAGLAAAFAVGYYLSPRGDLWFLGLKLALLLLTPLAVVRVSWREWSTVDLQGRWLRPIAVVAVYIGLTSVLTPWSGQPAPLVVLLTVFLVNSALEEVFYRFWLQTRLESLYGRWPAIVVSALLWAVWHAAIQGGNGVALDLASVVANQGVTGLFLGYLWSRHRNPWVLILAHGLVNAPIAMIIASV